jgi:hypothetical protein
MIWALMIIIWTFSQEFPHHQQPLHLHQTLSMPAKRAGNDIYFDLFRARLSIKHKVIPAEHQPQITRKWTLAGVDLRE